ncbi:hypothetical protein B0H13DRAFT_2672429 [Mycena leptocephala]|nr:hypothetical protein B0H13DRAFT_2672429 [Mycena leptocephala]
MSSATAALRTRIEELSRNNVRRDLNAICDPMARVPLEISSDIFMRCLPNSPRLDPGNFPMLSLRVCHLWSDIALATPLLWTTIHTKDGDAKNFDTLFEIWLNRAGSLPLSLSLCGDLHRVMPLVKQHAHHVQNLDLIFRSGELDDIKAPFSYLRKLTIELTPHYDDLGTQANYYIHGFIEIFRGAPSLVECELRGMPRDDVGDTIAESLLHPSLRLLRLGAEGSDSSAGILRHLTLPALEGLLVSALDIPSTEFISFLTRSSPPLKCLHLTTHDPIDRIFRLIPSLTELHLEFWSWNLTNEEAPLSCLAADCLPNLRSLTIIGSFLGAHSEYKNLIVRVLTARRAFTGHARLQSFRILFPIDKEVLALDGSTIASLRQLAEDGLHIHVGPKGNNYI